jgi:hypothetical protein
MYGTGEGEYVQIDLPSDFNRYKDDIYVRIIDTEKDSIFTTLTVNPIIYLP